MPLPDLSIEFAAMLHAHAAMRLSIGIVSRDVPDFQCDGTGRTMQEEGQSLYIQAFVVALARLENDV